MRRRSKINSRKSSEGKKLHFNVRIALEKKTQHISNIAALACVKTVKIIKSTKGLITATHAMINYKNSRMLKRRSKRIDYRQSKSKRSELCES